MKLSWWNDNWCNCTCTVLFLLYSRIIFFSLVILGHISSCFLSPLPCTFLFIHNWLIPNVTCWCDFIWKYASCITWQWSYSHCHLLGMYNQERRLPYSHLLTRYCPCNSLPEPISPQHEYSGGNLRPPCDVIHDVITMKNIFLAYFRRSYHICGQIEAVLNIS